MPIMSNDDTGEKMLSGQICELTISLKKNKKSTDCTAAFSTSPTREFVIYWRLFKSRSLISVP